MIIPTVEEIQDLHERYAPSRQALKTVYSHCEIVWRIAEQLIERSADVFDRDLVRAGCLLHDIGVYRLYREDGSIDQRNYVRHGVLGREILESEGFSEVLCRFCSCHTGVGLTSDDVIRQKLPLPPADYLAVTPEERIVMYADKFHSKTKPPKFLTADAYAIYVARFGDEKVDTFNLLRKSFGDPDVASLAETYSQAVELPVVENRVG
nr:HD domain-containing protein [Streptomyces sp. NBC_00899]WSX81473.1 HD domain-containing protein [Streptomyces sp. NBC_00899]